MIGIYGANGFIGRHLVRHLADSGKPVRAVSRRFTPSFAQEFHGKVELIEADLSASLAIASSLQDVEVVIQLASSSSPGLSNDHQIADIHENVIPHVEFLQNSVHAGVRRYVFLSSGGTVYGPGAPVPTPETCLPNPISSHGLTKVVVEKYIQMYGYLNDLEYAILRVANPFGPGQMFRKGQGLIPAILDRWRSGNPIKIFGKGQSARDFLYIDDLIEAIVATVNYSSKLQHILNIGSGQARSVNEVIETLERNLGCHFQREFVDSRSTDVDISRLDITQAQKLLGWQPKTAFEEGIRLTVAAYLKDKNWHAPRT